MAFSFVQNENMQFLLFSFDSYLLNISSNLTQMVTIESLSSAWSLRLRNNDFSRLNNKRVKALQSSIIFYIPCIKTKQKHPSVSSSADS